VFRSDDGATSWRSAMNDFDVNPRSFASSTSLACGAIAMHPDHPDEVFVGTGEGDTHHMFADRVVNFLPAYRGIGPIYSRDGGTTWIREKSTPDLAGHAFFALAVDPHDPNNVVAATTLGLYQRVPSGAPDVAAAQEEQNYEWLRRQEGVYCSVVVVSTNSGTRFFAASWGGHVMQSADGDVWQPVGRRFPTRVGRIALGAKPDDPTVIYALVATRGGALKGLYRLSADVWTKVRDVPPVLLGTQGYYDLAIAVDPVDVNLIYLGGDCLDNGVYSGSIWRCEVGRDGSGFRVTARKSIGRHAHADIHVLTHTPGDRDELWCGCDGGVFLNRDPRGNGRFASHNVGLAALCCNFIAQHPEDPNLVFTGLQDNGTARMSAGPVWKRVTAGDGGYCVVNGANPRQVLVFIYGSGVFRSTTGGRTIGSWRLVLGMPESPMTPPIVSPPYDDTRPDDARYVAAGLGRKVKVSNSFGAVWSMGFNLSLRAGDAVLALAFASTERLFIGTALGAVFRADWSGTRWIPTPLDQTLDVPWRITDVAVDWADDSLQSVYVVFGGMGNDRGHVWHFDGRVWESRSGEGATGLLDVEHNALVVDRQHKTHLYVGADIGVWHSEDGGRHWRPMQQGLPDAAVFDLQMHPTQRLLRAALHGRGVYEIPV
jgi:hypothetical protein